MPTNETLLTKVSTLSDEISDLRKRQVRWVEAEVTAVDSVLNLITVLMPDTEGGEELSGVKWPHAFLPDVGDNVRLIVAGAQPLSNPGGLAIDAVTGRELAPGSVGSTNFEPLIILGSVFIAGDPNGQYTQLDDTGLSYQAIDNEGIPYTASRFGKEASGTDAGGNITWEVDEDGVASFQNVSTNQDPLIMGEPFTDYVYPKAQFHGGASIGGNTDPANSGSGAIGYYEATFEFYPGHIYELHTSNIWVRSSTPANRADMNLWWEWSTDPDVDPPAVTTTSPIYARSVAAMHTDNTLGHHASLHRIIKYNGYVHARFLIGLTSTGGGAAYFEMGSANTTGPHGGTTEPEVVQIWVNDLGQHEWTNRAKPNSGGGGGTPPTAAKRYTYTYHGTWTQRFNGSGSVHSNSGEMAQGYTPYYTANGDSKSFVGGFQRDGTNTPIATDLAGATIEKFEVYLYARHWHYNGGGTGLIRYHNNASAPGSYINVAGLVTIPGWLRGQGRWVNITSWGNFFRDGGAKGIVVGPSGGTNPIYYGIFHGHTGTQPPKIRATFTK